MGADRGERWEQIEDRYGSDWVVVCRVGRWSTVEWVGDRL